ncbi:MAG: CHRD domain-containing protein [Candidatus Colwellbacteria bacterium]|nr:CHRD domain-containing protein [Candidatus Colwellbacteria bacterium]
MNKFVVIAAVVILALVGWWIWSQGGAPTTPGTEETSQNGEVTGESATIQLAQSNFSGVSGAATLIESGNNLVVMIETSGAPGGVAQPAHIHAGTCSELGGIVYELAPVLDGSSEIQLSGVSLSDLAEQMPLAINVHKSAEEIGVNVACGDISL